MINSGRLDPLRNEKIGITTIIRPMILCTSNKLITATFLVDRNLDKIIVSSPTNAMEKYGTSKNGNIKAIIAEDRPRGRTLAKITTIGFSSISNPNRIKRKHVSKRTPKEIVKKIMTANGYPSIPDTISYPAKIPVINRITLFKFDILFITIYPDSLLSSPKAYKVMHI